MESKKICSKCQTEKPLTDFHKWKKGKDGHRPDCKECRKAESKAQQANQNRRRSERWHTDSEYRQRISNRHKKYNPKAMQRERQKIERFDDSYVIKAIIRNTDLKPADIKKHPVLIEAQRVHMKLNRYFKNGTKH